MNYLRNFLIILGLSPYLIFAEDDYMNTRNEVNLSTEDKIEAREYMHEGVVQDTINEECTGDICSNQDTAFKSDAGKMIEQMMPFVVQAYNLFGTLSASMGSSTMTLGEGEDAEELNDYCQYIPLATEIAAQATQAIRQQQLEDMVARESASSNRQLQTMYAVSQAQKERHYTSIVQASGWGATGVCYSVYIGLVASGGGSPGQIVKMIAKTAAAVGLTTYYGYKAKAHLERHEAVEEIIAKLPKQGDCNPHTQTTCFCNQENSAATDSTNYNRYCVPAVFANRQDPDQAVVCVNQAMKADEECKCARTNSCFDTIVSTGALGAGFATTDINSIMPAIKPMSRGLGSANLSSLANGQAAIARKKLKENDSKLNIPNMNSKQKNMAKGIAKAFNIPNKAAAHIATANQAKLPAALAQAVENVKSGEASGSLIGKDSKTKFVRKSSSRSYGGGASPNFVNPFLKKKKDKKNAQSNVEVLDFYEKAEQAASINRDSSASIFEIISHRYLKTLGTK